MEVIPNEIDYARKRVSNSNPLYKLSESGEVPKLVHFKLPSILDPNQKNPNSKKLYKNSIPTKNHTITGTNLAEGIYDSFHISFPANLVSIEYVMTSLKHHRKTQSINDLKDLLMGSPLSSSGDISRCTSERWNFDFLEKPVVPRKLPKYPLNFSKFSSESGSVSSGVIHTRWKDELPYFEFYLRGKGGEYFVANPLMVNNINSRGLDYIYLVYKGVPRKNYLNFVGMMEVSSSLILNPGRCCYVDTEFVLFSIDPTGCDSCCSKNKGFMEKALDILRPSNPFSKSKSIRRGNFGESSVVDESSFTGFLSQQFPSEFESCAIVVRSNQCETKKEPISSGWGLNFLQKADCGERNGENCGGNGGQFGVELSVLLPSGVHGRPDTGNGGPSRLIDRWKSGGLCDCGGWDLGCPITVLKNGNSISNKGDLLKVDENGTVDLSIEGSKQGNPVIRLSKEKEGVNMVFSNRTLSALQCFSAGIAILHQQIPEFGRKI
ncbi:hypothetical protein LUZ61_010088 [Rhynchospora tenuis]|uniref:Uncharacterized protein n=1 Tax=Rhynchospora tenuis TaxID=198213 RepID=A0AAD5ZYM2_9POAL|nr:hypothetical protein LUZ61_010088 [Rhynchospora tenuis]